MSDAMATTTTTERHHEPASKFSEPGTPRPALERPALSLFEQNRQVWTCKVPAGVTAEDLLYPDLWKNVATKVSRHDIIFAIADDESWECECRVEAAKPDGVEVSISKKLRRKPFSQRQTVLGDGHFVTAYQNGSWCVLRVKDQFPVIRGHATESAAVTHWLREQPRKG